MWTQKSNREVKMDFELTSNILREKNTRKGADLGSRRRLGEWVSEHEHHHPYSPFKRSIVRFGRQLGSRRYTIHLFTYLTYYCSALNAAVVG